MEEALRVTSRGGIDGPFVKKRWVVDSRVLDFIPQMTFDIRACNL